ncbi:FixG Ig-like domain-containing protein [Streptomyces sp. Rer75]|uniref:COG1470 family protein n=1 Tax=Streptomyces sp. Rer75 TaxID=2750011 RepID=UPI0015CFEF2A|nr:FixG Ig-like domain-containing protein [Streptomyces sp. Rer75]QLH22235.1 hypothetical protein HYQ63_17795 [Streptomyces sp. Rer75]
MPSRTGAALRAVAALFLEARIAAALAVLLALLGAPPAPAAAAGPGWSAAPAPGAGSAPDAADRPYFYLEGRPGTVLQDKLSVTNKDQRPHTLRLRSEGAEGAWLAFADRTVRVPARTRADVPFTVTVPPDAAPGDRSGALVVTGGGHRTGVRMHLRISGATLSALSVEDVRVVRTGSGGGAAIRYAVVNRGNTELTPRLAVRADGLFGAVLRRDARTLPVQVPPGERVRLTERWPDAPALDAVDVKLTVTAGGGAHAAASATYTAAPGWLLAAAAAAALGVAGGGGTWLFRRRKRSRTGGTESGAST